MTTLVTPNATSTALGLPRLNCPLGQQQANEIHAFGIVIYKK
jgi:hypothetical protein